MYKNPKFLYPKPTIDKKVDKTFNFSEPYPFPIPPEICPDCPFPKSLCEFADNCPVVNTFSNFDEDTILECKHAVESGCPIYLLKFNEFESFEEIKNIELFALDQEHSKKFDLSYLAKIVENFKLLKNFHEVPIAVLGHGEDQSMLKESGLPAAGWISNVMVVGRKLFGDIKDIPKKLVPLFKNGAYKKKSIELYKRFPFQGRELSPVLRRVAFLGFDIPKIKGIGDILARYSEEDSIIASENNLTIFTEDLKMKLLQRFKYSGLDESDTFMLKDIIKSEFASGKIIELSENTISVELDTEDFFSEGDFSNEKGVTATFAEDSIPAPYSKNYKSIEEKVIKELGVTQSAIKAAVIASVAGKTLTDKQKKILQLGWPGTHGSPKKKFSAVKTDYPYPKTDKMSEDDKLKLEQFQEFKDENEKLKLEIDRQGDLIGTQATRIKSIEDDRSSELSLSHLKDIQTYSESLKNIGVSASFFDDSSFRPFIMSLDWEKSLKFSEDKDPQTFFEQFKELFSEIVDLAKENKLIVPLGKLAGSTTEETPDVTGYDPEGVKLDTVIRAYAEKNKVSYDAAYEVVISEQAKKNKK